MDSKTYHNLTVNDFAQLFGAKEEELSVKCKTLIEEMDFRYQIVSDEERDQLILSILKRISSDELKVSGEERKYDWEKGWAENLERFNKIPDIQSLIPGYFRPYQILRLNHKYIKVFNPKFEINFYTIFRYYLFEKYLKDFDPIYEFGCGTGIGLVILAQVFPEKKIHGLDWVNSSKKLVDKIALMYGYNLTGHLFDMFHPDYDIEIPNNSAFITFHSLEQLGNNYEQFLQFIIQKRPMLCLNVEPIIELYNKDNLIDYLALMYHKKRGYLANYLTRLKQIEKEGKIAILNIHRVPFGSMYHEANSIIVWKVYG